MSAENVQEAQVFTRKDYMTKVCSHSEYYAQFVTKAIKAVVLSEFSISTLKVEIQKDRHLNTLPLKRWDLLADRITLNRKFLNEVGEIDTPCSKVCTLKEAARQLTL